MTDAQMELAILRKYVAGLELVTIAEDLGVNRDAVAEVVSAVGFQRGRARELLQQREAALAHSRPRPTQAAAPDERAAQLAIAPQPNTIEQLLLRAEAVPRLRARAARMRQLLDALEGDLETAAAVAQAEERVARARAELEEATKALRGITRPAAQPVPAEEETRLAVSKVIPRAVRAWAAEHGIACPASGRPPRSVVEQYLAARAA